MEKIKVNTINTSSDMDKNACYPIICSWCGKVLRYGPIEHSHAICQLCADKLLAEFQPCAN